MTAAIKVTVAGPDVTAEVALDQVRAHLGRKGWERRADNDGLEMWLHIGSSGGPDEPRVWIEHYGDAEDVNRLRLTLHQIARAERRHPAEVLREIAGGAAPSADLDLDAIEARATAATPGPWGHGLGYDQDDPGAYVYQDFGVGNVVATGRDPIAPPDVEFIAHARVDVPALITEVRRLRALLAQEAAT